VGYRLLQEYFTFPEKFLFFDIAGFDRIRQACPGSRLELIFLISPYERADRRAQLEAGVTADTLRLGCTPVVNLFPQVAEPVQLTQRRPEYLVIPDARRRAWTGIFSVEEVSLTTPGSKDVIHVEPFHSFRHHAESGRPAIYWTSRRRASGWREDRGTDVWLSFVDLSARTIYPDADTATARVLSHNADLPARLPFGNATGDFEIPGGGPVKKILALTKPTAPIHPPLGKPQLWRLISQLSLNYMSLVDGGAEGLRELLRLHNFADSPAAERQIVGIQSVTGAPVYSRIDGEHGMTFARGHRVEIGFDEEEYAGGGVYLMAAVLERFLGLYVSLNSFCVLAARTRQRKELLREWPPRSGWKALI
jgi:type VI secretion system protein ImpG